MSFDWKNVAIFGLVLVVLFLLHILRYLITGDDMPAHWRDTIGRWDEARRRR